MAHSVRVSILVASALALAACRDSTTSRLAAQRSLLETAGGAGRPPGATVILARIPHVAQKPDFCGEACAEMALRGLGKPIDQDDVFDASGLDPALGRGVYTAELKTALERIGFRVGNVWRSAAPGEVNEALSRELAELVADLRRGIPSIVCMHYGEGPGTTEHFRLIVGYDAERDDIVYHEPAESDGAYRRMPRDRFLSLWPLRSSKDATLIRLRLEPEEIAVPARPAGARRAAYAQHVMSLRRRIPAGFTWVVEPPFVVIGDGGREAVRASAARTVRWAAQRLKQDFFTKDPADILDVWLFKDDASYREYTRAIFGDKPSTPYGYYASSHGALLMNISTGGGTLVHEIVHPFMETNVPSCPPWLNEGLGSLFEQSGERDGHIRGETNWRLPSLQSAIKAGRVPSFKALTSAQERAFYEDDPGTNYAQARYLLYYLQENALLLSFWRRYLAHRVEDPTGFETLKATLGETDMVAFKARWEAFVLGLSFRG
jgi:hypothetical protein